MKIVTYNTQHCENYNTKKIDFEAFAKQILEFDPDIIGLNEIRGKGESEGYENQLQMLSDLTGYKNGYFAQALLVRGNNPYGNAFLTKYEIESVETIGIPDPNPKKENSEFWYETRCLLKAKLKNGLTVLVTHFGLNPDEQVNAVKVVVENLVDEKCILMGDFNTTPDDEVLAPIRAKMKDSADVFTEEKFSMTSYEPTRKIDYIFVSPDIEVLYADIPDIILSDHRPYVAEINVKGI